jgi:ATP-dependent DNA helicase RecQ
MQQLSSPTPDTTEEVYSLADAERVLQQVFGYDSFRGLQGEIIEHVLQGNDGLVLMPTGGGKSLCYQIPSLLRKGMGVVISPLIALMQDQVDALTQLGIRAAFLNSSLEWSEQQEVKRAVAQQELDLLYVAPERLWMPGFLSLLQRTPLALFAIDEAHCVSQWGHDFRPEYRTLRRLAEEFPEVPRIALTATADETTRVDITHELCLDGARLFCSGFDRPNIRIRVALSQHPKQQLLDFLEMNHKGDAGIVYCLSRKRVESTAKWLAEKGWDAIPYHAGLSPEERRENQQRFLNEEGVVVCATVAFGMGIDKPNVRFVAHLNLPKSLEGYYQEIGRAGRDGLPANAWMLYNLQDVLLRRRMIEGSEAAFEIRQMEHVKFDALLGYCEAAGCRRQVLLSYFGERLEESCNNCDVCKQPISTWDGTVAAQKALSCVYRTGQQQRIKHLIDVLMGERTPRVVEWKHDRVSTFGIGTELDDKDWRSVYRQLIAHGLLTVDLNNGGLVLTAASTGVLRGEREMTLRKDPIRRSVSRRKPKSKSSRGAWMQSLSFTSSHDYEIFEQLRQYRLKLAKDQDVPPYIIFSDRTLMELVLEKPSNLEELRRVYGVGKQKLARYGQLFLDELQKHL